MLENGLNGFPRACRSVRPRGPVGKKAEGAPNQPFEILASVAGKLLDNGDKFYSSRSSNYEEERYCSCDELGDSDRACEDFDSGISSASSKSKELDLDKKSKVFREKKGFGKSTQFSEVIGGNDRGVSVETTREFELRRNRKRKFRDETGSLGDEKTLDGKRQGLTGFLTCHASSVRVVRKDKDEISRGAIPSTKNPEMKKISLTEGDDNHCSEDGRAREGSEKIYPYKKRKFFDFDPSSTTDGGFNREGVSIPSEKRINGKTSAASQRVTPNSKDCNVKLSIKSFKVPELFIDISTNATVGSLKRTVMEAVTSILGDGLHVGILVRGKKVRDDNKTLIQTGISQYDKCDNLGFVLEPKHSRTATSMLAKSERLMPKKHGVTRHSEGTTKASLHRPLKSLGSGCVESDKTNPSCKSIVPVTPTSLEPLAVAPLARKSGHQEYGQRRIRRPFSVSEVEALVRAVEKLGTGRWRDVKFHAFDNAKHRTYVDLKDKWKTLVHTARISPQQRRGEPVPQELLDRVLAAQSHWSHSHRPAKQHARITA